MIWGETGLCHSSIIDINSITTVPQKVSYQPLARRELRCALRDSRFTLWLMNAIPYGSGRRPKSVGIVAKIIGWFQDSLVKLYQVPGSSLSLFQQRISNGHSRLYTLVPEVFHESFVREKENEPKTKRRRQRASPSSRRFAARSLFPKEKFQGKLLGPGYRLCSDLNKFNHCDLYRLFFLTRICFVRILSVNVSSWKEPFLHTPLGSTSPSLSFWTAVWVASENSHFSLLLATRDIWHPRKYP